MRDRVFTAKPKAEKGRTKSIQGWSLHLSSPERVQNSPGNLLLNTQRGLQKHAGSNRNARRRGRGAAKAKSHFV